MTAHTVRPSSWREDIVGRLVRLARRRPDHPAVIDSAGEVSFRTLYTAAARQADTLEKQTDHGVVVVPATPTADFYIQLCAAWLAGRTPLPLPAAAPSMLVDQAVRAVAGAHAGGCLAWKAVLSVDGNRQIPMVTHGESPIAPRKALGLGLVPGGRALIAAPLHLNGPLEFSFRQLLLGGTVVITPSFTPQRWLQAMHGHRPDWAFLVPTQLQRVWDATDDEEIRRACTSLRLLLHSSAPCPPALRERLGGSLSPSRVAEYYGTTVYDGTFAPYTSTEPGGAPLPGAELRVVDRHGWPVPSGSDGFIEGRSRAGLITHPADRPCPAAPAWHGVGDVGRRVGTSGRLLVTDVFAAPGRVIVAGVKVAVEDTRIVLAAHPGVDSCTVTAQPHPVFGSVLAAQVLALDPRLTAADLRSWCARSLTSPQRPHFIDLRVSSGVPALAESQGEGHA